MSSDSKINQISGTKSLLIMDPADYPEEMFFFFENNSEMNNIERNPCPCHNHCQHTILVLYVHIIRDHSVHSWQYVYLHSMNLILRW